MWNQRLGYGILKEHNKNYWAVDKVYLDAVDPSMLKDDSE